ncbi:outer membrane protein assembly factor BamB family protein [Sphingobium sp. CR28]|uniref:outer membrane protein assembly factor BamB family protein n=1 Tax=Sphingobium sp. CR28 TaxID=3400272 RepID=UPI003FF02B46
MTKELDRRHLLASASGVALLGFTKLSLGTAFAQGSAPRPGAGPAASGVAPASGSAPADTNWYSYAADLSATRYAPLDQINATNFNSLEVAWRFKTDSFGSRPDAYFNATPLVVNRKLYSTVGFDRYVVCLDPGTGQILWTYRHDEKGRLGARAGSGFGLAHWTDGTEERILFVTRSYQLISLDAKTGRPDPNFGDGTEVDLRKEWDAEIDPVKPIVGLHAAPTIVRNTVVVGNASTSTNIGHLRGYDVKTGKRKWIFHTVPKKGEFGYDTWIVPGQAEKATNTGVWAPMSADPELGLVYAGVELPQTDYVGTTRHGDGLFSETLVALDCETGERKWHYQLEHHGIWDRDVPCAAILLDLPGPRGRVIKALAQPSKQGFLFVLDRTTGKPVWPIPEKKVEIGNAPGEWYSPTQPFPSKPPPFTHQGFKPEDVIDWTPEIKARALEIISHYKLGPIYTPPSMVSDTNWGTLAVPESQGGANWPGGSVDPVNSLFYIYSKANTQVFGVQVGASGQLTSAFGGVGRGNNDNMGGAFGGAANPGGRAGNGGPVPPGTKDGLNDPITKGMLTIGGMSLLKPPWGRITALDLKTGTKMWEVAHGETPDFVTNNPLLKGVKVPRTGQSGILGVMTTKSLVICGDSGLFTDEKGRKAARLRAYDKMTGTEVGAVFMDQAQTGSPMTYMFGGRQYIVVASGGLNGAELIAYRLPAPAGSVPPEGRGPRPGPSTGAAPDL